MDTEKNLTIQLHFLATIANVIPVLTLVFCVTRERKIHLLIEVIFI